MKRNNVKLNLLASINPLNKDVEKRKFFFDANYNPQFVYAREILPAELRQFGNVSLQHEALSKRIIDNVIKTWKTENAFLEATEGRLLTREEVSKRISEYLKEHKLEQVVNVHYTHRLISRTSIDGFTMNIRLPIEYRELSFRGVLDHEIGTHILRRLNDKKQIWNGQREKYEMHKYSETEEGLATLHNQVSMNDKHIWLKALLYYAVILGSTMTFSQLFAALKPYVDNRDRRWNVCLRVKRGISDTSVPGVFTKDQVYLNGLLRVIAWMKDNDFDITPLYFGKIDVRDARKARTLNPQYVPLLPTIFSKDPKEYRKQVEEFIRENGL